MMTLLDGSATNRQIAAGPHPLGSAMQPFAAVPGPPLLIHGERLMAHGTKNLEWLMSQRDAGEPIALTCR